MGGAWKTNERKCRPRRRNSSLRYCHTADPRTQGPDDVARIVPESRECEITATASDSDRVERAQLVGVSVEDAQQVALERIDGGTVRRRQRGRRSASFETGEPYSVPWLLSSRHPLLEGLFAVRES